MKKIKSRNLRIRDSLIFRTMMSLMVVIVLFYCSNYVDAGMNDSLIEKNRMDGVYAVATIDGRTRIFYLNMYELNDRVSYCIDLGVDVTTEIYNSTNDFSVSYLSKEQIEFIRSISYYGYKYVGHDDYRYYMAAQEIIWEYLSGIGVEWTNELNVNGERVNIDEYKNEIFCLMDNDNGHKLQLDLKSGQVYTVGEEIKIGDKSGYLSEYEVVSSKYSGVSIDRESLVVKVGNVIGTEVIALRKKEYYEYESALYYYDGSQRLISNGNYRDVDEVVNFEIKGAVINAEVKKSSYNYYSPDSKLEGAVYELYDSEGNLLGTYTSDKRGKFSVDGLLLGTYYIKQIKASEGFKIKEERLEVIVDKKSVNIILKQDFILNSFRLTKVYGSNGNYKPEYGASFRIFYSDGSHYCCLMTNRDGIDDFELAYGTYRVSQVNTMNGYAKVEDFVIEVKEEKEDKVYFNLIDEQIQIKIKVVSVDKKSREQLIGNDFSYRIRKKDKNTYIEFDGESLFSSDDMGNMIIPGVLTYGDYVIEQVSVPEGVVLNDDDIEFTIDNKSKLDLVDGNMVMNVGFINELVMGKVNVLAYQEEYYKDEGEFGYKIVMRDGSDYQLIAKDDIEVNGKAIYRAGEEVYRGSTLEDGSLVIDNLYLGSYCLVDVETGEEQCFELKGVDNSTSIVEKSFEFTKYLEKANLIIKNEDSNGEVIEGSIFEVIDKDNVVIYKGITNEEGIIKVENMLVGNYCIRQFSVDEGFELNEEEICLLVDSDKEIRINNNIIVKEVVSVPNTLSRDIGIYEGLVILVLIGTGILVYKKIFCSKLYR